jgi:hypothetical protein
MDTNVDNHRGTSARDEKKCDDISNALMLVEEKQGKVGRPNGETTAMDTEANNTNAPRTAMDTETDETNADTEKDDGAPESGLDNLDRESTGNPGAEMETDLPKALGKLSGDYNQDGTEEETLQDKEAGTAIRSCKRRMSVENSGNMEPPSHLLRDRSNSDNENGAARHMQDVTGMTEHFSEEPEEQGHGTTMTMTNPGQNTKDVPEAITQEHAVKEQEVGESETLLEEKGEKNTAMGGVHENRDLENKEDRRIQPYGDERRRKSNDVRQGAQLLTPVEMEPE